MKHRRNILVACFVMLLLMTWIGTRWFALSPERNVAETVAESPVEVPEAESHAQNFPSKAVRQMQKNTAMANGGFLARGGSQKNHFELVSATPRCTRILFSLDDYRINSTEINGVRFSVLDVPGAWSGNLKGKPQIPMFMTRLAVPVSKKAQLNVLSEDWEEIPCDAPVPAMGLVKWNDKAEPPVPDEEIYSGKAVWPKALAVQGKASMLRRTCLLGVTITPMAYDFGRHVLKVCRRCEIEVTCDDAESSDYATLSSFADFSRLQTRGVLNSSLLLREDSSENCAGRILFILPDGWAGDAVEEYLEWKNTVGFETQVKTYPSDTGAGAEGISKTVTAAYNDWRLTHLVLVGRIDELPSAIMATKKNKLDNPSSYDSSFMGDLAVSDVPYALLEGKDDYQDVFLSRIPVRSEAELAAVLLKLRMCESESYDENVDDSWRPRGVFIGGDISGEDYYRKSQVPPELRDMDDADVIEMERQRLISDGGFAADSFSFYRSMASAELIQAGLNVGAGLCSYIGHGLNDGWTTGKYYITHAKTLSNGMRLPFVCSYACLTGNFGCNKEAKKNIYNQVHFTDDGDCLAEGLLRCETGGACGVLAATNDVSIIPPYYMMMKLDDDVIAADSDERLMTLGAYSLDAILAGIEYSETTTYACAGIGDEIARQFHLIGDCSLAGRFRRLQPMTMRTARTDSGIEVTVLRGASPVRAVIDENMKPVVGIAVTVVCQKSGLIQRMLTDSNGSASFVFKEEELARPMTIHAYDPMSGLKTCILQPVDSDGDGEISDQELLDFLAKTTSKELRNEAIMQWKESGADGPAPASSRSGVSVKRGDDQPQVSVPKKNDEPFDCRANPHGKDNSLLIASESASRGTGYCTYDEMISRIEACWVNHWDICRPEFVGESLNGRQILGMRIGRMCDSDFNAELLIAGGIHGNERPGVEVSLLFAEWLLEKSSSDDEDGIRVRNLLDRMTLFVIPCMNPDGMVAAAEAGSNSEAWEAARENANGIDLNRSYPDGVVNSTLGQYGAGASLCLDESLDLSQSGMLWSGDKVPETVAFMKWCCAHRLSGAVFLHTGSSVVCYPYGNNAEGKQMETACPDSAMLKYLAKGYVAHSTMIGMVELNSAAWYPVHGEAADWVYRFLGVLPLTVEISRTKEPAVSQLNIIFNQQRPALFWWLEAASTGVGGRVKTPAGDSIAFAKVALGDGMPSYTDSTGRFFMTGRNEESSVMISFCGFDNYVEQMTPMEAQIVTLSPSPDAIQVACGVPRERYLPNYPEDLSVSAQDSRNVPAEYIIRISGETARISRVTSDDEWRWNKDGSASVLYAKCNTSKNTFDLSMIHSDRPLKDHRILLSCRTVSDVTQMIVPWVSAAQRTLDIKRCEGGTYSLPGYLEKPTNSILCFQWQDGEFRLVGVEGEKPLVGYYWERNYIGKESIGKVWDVSNWTWRLSAGWNFIGVPWRMPSTVFEAVLLHGGPGLTLVGEMVPGKAYWVYSSGAKTIR